MKRRITVTQKDFEKAERLMEDSYSRLSESCPNALAIRRIFKNQHVSVGAYYINIGSRSYRVPELGQKVMNMFDLYKINPVASSDLPIRYTIEI